MKSWPLPAGRSYANLNTATFDRRGRLWFTGQSGVYGRLDPRSGDMQVWDAPRGRGPYGIATTPEGDVYYASLAGSHIARIDLDSGAATVIEPPTKDQGARRVWSDSKGRIWVSEWHSGHVSRYDPKRREWKTWKLPGERPQTSPFRPSICRTLAGELGRRIVVKRAVRGSKRTIAFAPKSVSQTKSRSST